MPPWNLKVIRQSAWMEQGMLLPRSDDFGSRWENVTEQGKIAEPDLNPVFCLKKHAVLTQKRPILTPFQRENRKIQGAGQKRKVQQTLEFTGLFWRRGWDSNPCAIARKLISSQPRYDHFDTSPCMSNTVRTP